MTDEVPEARPADRRRKWILKAGVVVFAASAILGGALAAFVEQALDSQIVFFTVDVTLSSLISTTVFVVGFGRLAGDDLLDELWHHDERRQIDRRE